ncbi:MAG: hypothetical protein FP814_02090 [Desulfobacterium sp.]|nr:hypothetical protein [Desulfobacterium sp.]
MKVCVQGLWHLGSVTAGCLASVGHKVVGLDFDEDVIRGLRVGEPPIFEPGLEEMIRAGVDSERLEFVANPDELRATSNFSGLPMIHQSMKMMWRMSILLLLKLRRCCPFYLSIQRCLCLHRCR